MIAANQILNPSYFTWSFTKNQATVTPKTIIAYFYNLTVDFHGYSSLFGFCLFAAMALQILTGVMLSFSYIPDPMLIALVRDEEDVEDLYIDDFFWMHERGVDLLVIFVFLHLFKKLYVRSYGREQEYAWKTGSLSFLILQLVIFLGLVLCGTHLSEVTLTIAVNAIHVFMASKGKVYWWFFTDRYLNADTLLRLAYGHYCSAIYLVILGVIHGVEMHYDWKTNSSTNAVQQQKQWWEEVLSNEINAFFVFLFILNLIGFYLYKCPEPLNYELFMWGDVGAVVDIRFLGVAPHWYFRPYMSWLVVCPSTYIGIFGLIFFFFSIYFHPNLHGKFYTKNQEGYDRDGKKNTNKDGAMFYLSFAQAAYYIFLAAAAYTTSFLPFGRFYSELGGNDVMLAAYFWIFFYLGLPRVNFYNYFNNVERNAELKVVS